MTKITPSLLLVVHALLQVYFVTCFTNSRPPAFLTQTRAGSTQAPPSSSSLFMASTTEPVKKKTAEELEETFYQAVEMASSTTTAVDLDEADRLATELELFDNENLSCEFEETLDLCEKEVQDRLDVAEILRLKIELHLRLDYLKNANLFADDVRKEHDAHERQKFKDALIANREKSQDGSDLGLW